MHERVLSECPLPDHHERSPDAGRPVETVADEGFAERIRDTRIERMLGRIVPAQQNASLRRGCRES